MGWNRMVERRFILVAKHNLRRCSEHRTCNLDLHCGFNTDDQCHRATHSRLKFCRDYATCEGTRLLRTVPFYSGREIASPRVYYVSGETDSVFVCVCVCVCASVACFYCHSNECNSPRADVVCVCQLCTLFLRVLSERYGRATVCC
jgi:hypothetical protein